MRDVAALRAVIEVADICFRISQVNNRKPACAYQFISNFRKAVFRPFSCAGGVRACFRACLRA